MHAAESKWRKTEIPKSERSCIPKTPLLIFQTINFKNGNHTLGHPDREKFTVFLGESAGYKIEEQQKRSTCVVNVFRKEKRSFFK